MLQNFVSGRYENKGIVSKTFLKDQKYLIMTDFRFYGKNLQDKHVYENFLPEKGGVFLDIGASDGVKYSNTFFFEKEGNLQGYAWNLEKAPLNLSLKTEIVIAKTWLLMPMKILLQFL